MAGVNINTNDSGKHSSGSKPSSNDNSENSDDNKRVSDRRGTRGHHNRPPRQRKMSADAAEAVANGVTYDEYVASYARAVNKVKQPLVSTPATAPSTAVANDQSGAPSLQLSSHTHSHSSSGHPSSLPAVPSSSTDHQLHGIIHQMGNMHIDHKSSRHNQSSVDTQHDNGHTRHRHHMHRRSPSQSSDSSSDDEYTRGRHSVYYVGRRIRAKDQLHLSMVPRMRALYHSFSEWCDDNKCTNTRNQYEMALLSAAMDRVLAIEPHISNAGRNDIIILQELLCRRIYGVQQADSTNDWSAAAAVDLLQRRELTNDRIARTVHRGVTALRAVATANKVSSSSSSHVSSYRDRGGYNRRGRGGHAYGKKGKSNNNKDNASSSSAVPSFGGHKA